MTDAALKDQTRDRVAGVREIMRSKEIDTLMVLIGENRRYLSGFAAEDHQCDESAGALIITARDLLLATDTRFEIQAGQEAPLYEVIVYRKGLAKELPAVIKRLGTRRLGFESGRVTVRQYNEFQKELKTIGEIEWVPVEDLVESLRLEKSASEIEWTRQALTLAERAFLKTIESLRPGMTEKALAWAMEKNMREAGADGISFPVIVAAGPNSALPHAIPTDRSVQEGEPILFDWGARLNGYCSDISRTVYLGKPDEIFIKVYHTVLEAQKKAIESIRSGISSKAVDAVARQYIRDQGFEGKFGHGLGHGTGLAVHEGPRLSPLKETTLKSGMIVTVEPGVYLPQWGGVRIENQVVVRQDGAIVLNALDTGYEIQRLKAAFEGV